MRKVQFINGECYHIYNRGVDKRIIFHDQGDYIKFLRCIKEFNDESTYEQRAFEINNCISKELSSFEELPKLVDIICYCINPNHYHFILRQLQEDGIKTFMHKLGTSYTNYYNKKNERDGSLFQGPFKAIHIDSNEYLLYLSAYVNLNNFIHNLKGDVAWKYSSFLDYCGKQKSGLCNMSIILDQFNGSKKDYEKFAKENSNYMKDKKEFKKYTIEDQGA